MKSEFALAFNQICAEYNLPREVVLDAVRAALATAYRRDWKVPSNQNVSADINLDTGAAKIYLEQVAVESVEDEHLEIDLQDALEIDRQVEVGDPVMVDVTPRNFGRIAAQTAKQVITQRLREAERESQYNRFSRQEGEIIIGTVQSVTPHAVTLHLERTEEARMPKREQIPGERYMLHQKIRVYVVEVRRTPRGPEITVSRSHPNMLRRMLELEVPEIRKGQVEIKAIAREAGTRAKVAVVSRQSGLDPVGACVGMRGIRIQTISNELHGERIDVVKWDKDVATFIANALSVEPVMAVLLDDMNGQGARTASVVVLDDQLSLAIGRSGQNARLAAKLTNWRIDIQGVTEAALWALDQVNQNPDLIDWLAKDVAPLVPRLAGIMHAHEKDHYPYTDEDLQTIKAVVVAIHQTLLERRRAAREKESKAAELPQVQVDHRAQKRARLAEARASVPSQAYQLGLGMLSLSEKVRDHLVHSDIENIGEVMERVAMGDEALLMLNGIGSKALKEIKQAVEEIASEFAEPEEEEVPAEMPADISAEATELVEVAEVPVADIEEEEATEMEAPEEEIEAATLTTDEEDLAAAEEVVEPTVESPAEEMIEEEVAQPIDEAAAEELEQEDVESAEEEEAVGFSLEDLDGISVGDYDLDETEGDLEEEILDKQRKDGKHKKSKRRKRAIIYDEETGETFVVRKRRRGRYKDGWDEY